MIVRELAGAAEAVAVEELQLACWGRNEREVVPRGMLVASQLQGGLLAGSFEGDVMTGFVFGFPTRDARVQHSHMTAVLPAHRASGTATALKAFQRAWCLERGLTHVQWTFDPLRGLNGRFNLGKLGAVITAYYPHLYGDMSGINAGVASDRALAVWDLAAQRTEMALAGVLPEPDLSDVPTVNPDGPEAFDPDLNAPRLRMRLPEDFGALIAADLALAVRWREHGRQVFMTYLGLGYHVTGFSREGGNAYLLERREL